MCPVYDAPKNIICIDVIVSCPCQEGLIIAKAINLTSIRKLNVA